MARLHKYSFVQEKSPAHDALLCECTSIEGAEIIILESLGSFPLIEYLKTRANDMQKRFLSRRKVLKKHLKYGDRLAYEIDLREIADRIDTYDDKTLEWTMMSDLFKFEIKDIEYNYEVEKLVTVSNKDLFGYADLIIDFNVCIVPRLVDIPHYVQKTKYNDLNQLSMDFVDDPRSAIKKHGTIVVELKPKITDIGAVLRQVKTYREYLPDITNTVIATFSEVSDDIRQIAKNENVTIVAFEGEVKEDIRNGYSPKQAYELSPQQAYAMSQKPPSESQLNYLQNLGYKGEVISMLEASAKIEELRSKKNDTFG